MSTRITATLIAGGLLAAGMAALAQSPAASPAADEAPAMTCQQLMDNAKPMVAQMTDATKIATAKKEMSLAQADLDAGKLQDCAKHMTQVMKMVK